MEIIANTERYSAQQLQTMLNPNPQQTMCVVLGGDKPNEYVIVVDNDFIARLIKGALDHYGISHN
jgi:hypothetical protein